MVLPCNALTQWPVRENNIALMRWRSSRSWNEKTCWWSAVDSTSWLSTMKNSCRSRRSKRARPSSTTWPLRSLPYLVLVRVVIQNRSETRSFALASCIKSLRSQKDRRKRMKKSWWKKKKPLEPSLKHTCALILLVQRTCQARNSVWSSSKSTEMTLTLCSMFAKSRI